MSEYLDDIYEGSETIRGVVYKLMNLSEAFHLTGNSVLGDDLYDLCVHLKQAEKQINSAVSKNINRSLKQSQEGIANILKAYIDN